MELVWIGDVMVMLCVVLWLIVVSGLICGELVKMWMDVIFVVLGCSVGEVIVGVDELGIFFVELVLG